MSGPTHLGTLQVEQSNKAKSIVVPVMDHIYGLGPYLRPDFRMLFLQVF